ncbi:hypothetical protein GCM10010106_00180 [Thermopolyspora flexuosa]|nr:hypothetical protein GCM10010106_00180 [Thermopolyspora flexuosa]
MSRREALPNLPCTALPWPPYGLVRPPAPDPRRDTAGRRRFDGNAAEWAIHSVRPGTERDKHLLLVPNVC